MQFTPTCLVLVLVGLLIFIGIRLAKIQRRRPNDFDVRIYWRHNWVQIILSTVCAFTVQFFADNFATGILDIHIHDDSNFYNIFALAAGFNNQVLFSELMKKKHDAR